MSNNKETLQQESVLQKFVFGGLSCMGAACVTNPIDVIKTRLQLQGELSKKVVQQAESILITNVNGGQMATATTATTAVQPPQYQGFVRGTLHIIKQEGIVGLYKGLSPSLLREATYSTIRMGGYDLIKVYFVDDAGKTSLTNKILAGGISGAVGASIANPTDLIKVRMQAHATKGGARYSSITQAFKDIVAREGVAGLYNGVGPTVQRAALLTASQLSSYDQFKHMLIDNHYVSGEGLLAHALSSIAAGFVAAVVTSPVDTVKTRIMNQPIAQGKGTLYSSTMDCIIKTVSAEGVLGLYKGFIPNWMRIGPHTIVTFILYEHLRKLGGISPV